MTDLQVFAILIAATWGSFGAIIKVFKALNARRDLILRGRDGDVVYHLEHRVMMFYSDFIPMQAGITVFMGVFALLLINLPNFANGETQNNLGTFCYIASVVTISGLIGYGLGGIKDIWTVGKTLCRRRGIESERRRKETIDRNVDRFFDEVERRGMQIKQDPKQTDGG